jgi:ppGpp synthetase/RelA/SpoT-type nucleotidyltranferase
MAQQFYLVEMLRQDKYTKPDRGGYRAFHVDYEIRDMNRWGLPPGTTVELQLTTWLQNLHSELSHRLLYKNTSAKSSSIIIKLEEMSTLLYETDARIAAQYASLFGMPSS